MSSPRTLSKYHQGMKRVYPHAVVIHHEAWKDVFFYEWMLENFGKEMSRWYIPSNPLGLNHQQLAIWFRDETDAITFKLMYSDRHP